MCPRIVPGTSIRTIFIGDAQKPSSFVLGLLIILETSDWKIINEVSIKRNAIDYNRKSNALIFGYFVFLQSKKRMICQKLET